MNTYAQKLHELTMFVLNSKDLSNVTPEKAVNLYEDTYKAINSVYANLSNED